MGQEDDSISKMQSQYKKNLVWKNVDKDKNDDKMRKVLRCGSQLWQHIGSMWDS